MNEQFTQLILMNLSEFLDIRDVDQNSLQNVIADTNKQMSESNILTATAGPSKVIFIDLFQLLSGVAGIVSSLAAISMSADLIAATAFVAALGAIKGYKTILPREQGVIVFLLFESDKKSLPKDQLKKLYHAYIAQLPDLGVSPDEFEDALIGLLNFSCIKIKDKHVKLTQKVMI